MGSSVGATDGELLGDRVDLKVGSLVGLVDGISVVGRKVGHRVGSFEGILVALKVGSRDEGREVDGFKLGEFVGDFVFEKVGLIDGARLLKKDGTDVGDLLGFATGSFDGFDVGVREVGAMVGA